MLTFILISAVVFGVVACVTKSCAVFIRSIPYILYIYVFLTFFDDSTLIVKASLLTVMLTLSVFLLLYKVDPH
jgi:hypothetical protein